MRRIAGMRKKNIEARITDYGIEGVLEIIAKVAASQFLTGKVEGTRWCRKGCDVATMRSVEQRWRTKKHRSEKQRKRF